MDRQIIIGIYDVDNLDSYDIDDFYRGDGEEIVRVRTRYGVMWVPLINQQGARSNTFDPKSERVLIFMLDPDYIISSNQGGEQVLRSDEAFGMVVEMPPQFRRDEINKHRRMKDDPGGGEESNSTPKLMVGSDSRYEEGVTFGMPHAKIVATEDKIVMKGPGGEILIGDEGILINGRQVNLDFFNESRAGLMKENWLGAILPPTVKVALEIATGGSKPMPNYLPDTALLSRIAGIADIVTELV